MHEDFITCNAPETEWTDNLSQELYCMAMIQLQQLHAQVSQFLLIDSSTAEASEFLAALKELSDKVEVFHTRLKPVMDLDIIQDLSQLANNRERDMVTCLQYKYYEILFRIHTSIVYPWVRPVWATLQQENTSRAVHDSMALLSSVSRKVLLSTNDLRLDPSCRFW
jgi:hypothetical protein